MGAVVDVGDVAEHYDELDWFYRDVWGEHVHHGLWVRGDEPVEEATVELSKKVVDMLGVGEGERVVDIGCGYGATARMVVERTGAEVEGWTVSREQYGQAVRAGVGDFVLGDWLDNELGDGEVDGVVSIECLSHVEDKVGFFREVERVLKPGGRFILCCWMRGDGWISDLVAGPVCRGGRFAGIWSEEEIVARWRRVERFEDLTLGVRRTWPSIVFRVAGRLLTVPGYRQRFLWRAGRREWGLAWTVLMTMLGFYTGGLRYGFFVFEKRC